MSYRWSAGYSSAVDATSKKETPACLPFMFSRLKIWASTQDCWKSGKQRETAGATERGAQDSLGRSCLPCVRHGFVGLSHQKRERLHVSETSLGSFVSLPSSSRPASASSFEL